MPHLASDKLKKLCTDCSIEYSINNFEITHKDIVKSGEVRAYRRNKCKDCRLKDRREAHAKVAHLPEVKYKKRMRGLYERYGISAEEYLDLAEKQENLCSICGDPAGSRALSVDHDHNTGEVRALLCTGCNLGLGWFKDNIEVMKKAINYLEKHNGQINSY